MKWFRKPDTSKAIPDAYQKYESIPDAYQKYGSALNCLIEMDKDEVRFAFDTLQLLSIAILELNDKIDELNRKVEELKTFKD